jgi:hypothetical protein
VTFAEGKLAVNADNSSLNQILREIGRETGIKITGGVADERVFGKYGPLPVSDVLASLLDGTGSNVLLIQADATSPGELILTPRQGGVTPPNPNAGSFEDHDSPSDDAAPALPVMPPQPPAQPTQPPAATGTPAAAPAVPADVQNPPAPASTTDPNGVKSPQQIFEQLQKLHQQEQPKQ